LILQPNIQLYNFLTPTVLFFLFATSLTLLATAKNNFYIYLSFSIVAGILFVFFHTLKRDTRIRLVSESELLQERINIISKSIEQKKKLLNTLPLKYQRVSSLFEVTQKLIELVEPEKIFDFLIKTLANLFPQVDNILLFNFDKEADSLYLVRSHKEKSVVIEEKTGDALDKWVLQQNRSLLVEDITKDFRFDYNRVSAYTMRSVSSFVLSPLSIEYRFLGMARLEAKLPSQFSLEDSRILRNVCDLGAVVMERAKLFKRAQDLAITDPLTNLYVKDYFFQKLKSYLNRSSAKKSPLSIVMLDIDDFKKINDFYGHMVGDTVLRKLAKIMSSVVGKTENIITRFGGEEFIILFDKLSREEVLDKAEEIRKTAENTLISFRRQKVKFTVSLGVAFYPDDGKTALELINKVDVLMYKAKKKGKNRVCSS